VKAHAIIRPVTFLAVAGLVLGAASPGASDAAADALALGRRIEARQQRVRDLTARFVQTYRSGALGRQIVERGTLAVKRPGRLRFEYQAPDAKVFVSDGRTSYFYVPADRQVLVRDQADARDLPTQILSGRVDLADRFILSLGPPAGGRPTLRLVPREADGDLAELHLEVDAADRIRALLAIDAQGNHSRFVFEDIRENVGLSDRLFRFQVPRGVEVVSG
jgi:outer membrane lipoprotein carrier protein